MPRVFVAGCGFIGLAVARLLAARRWEVTGATHSTSSAAALADEPFPVIAVDITDRVALRAIADASAWDAVIHSASSGHGGADAYRAIYRDGARHLAEVLQPRRLLFTSSTSVYAQTSGEWVNEESAAHPGRETGQILREAEEIVLAAGGCVARVAGIYGPGRSVLLRKLLAGEAVIEGDGGRWINQAHRDDIAAALAHLAEIEATGVFNVADDSPLTQRELFTRLAEAFALPLPPTGPVDLNRKRGVTSKRVSNARLRSTGWQPRFPSFLEAAAAQGRSLAAGGGAA